MSYIGAPVPFPYHSGDEPVLRCVVRQAVAPLPTLVGIVKVLRCVASTSRKHFALPLALVLLTAVPSTYDNAAPGHKLQLVPGRRPRSPYTRRGGEASCMEPNLRHPHPDGIERDVKSASDLLLLIDSLGKWRGVAERTRAVCGCNRKVVEPLGAEGEGLCQNCPWR